MALYGVALSNTWVAATGADTEQEVKEWAEERDRLTKELKDRLQVAQNSMKQ